MKSAFDQLNLRPLERRLVVGVGAVLFIVLNLVFVWPHFSARGKALEDLDGARRKLARFQKEVAEMPQVQKKMRALESAAEPVPEEDQGTEFLGAIQRQASQSGVQITGSSRMTTRTNNQFFLERSQTVTFASPEPQLIDFLYNIGTGSSMTRVRDLSLRPDAPRQRLTGNVKLVASYQKKPPPRKAAAPASAATNATPKPPPQKSPPAATPAKADVKGGKATTPPKVPVIPGPPTDKPNKPRP